MEGILLKLKNVFNMKNKNQEKKDNYEHHKSK